MEVEDRVQGWARGEAKPRGTHRCIFSSINVKPHLGSKGEQRWVIRKARGMMAGRP